MPEQEQIKQPKLYTPRTKSVYADGEYYVDGNRLHELLLEHRDNPSKPVSNELARMYILIVDNIMKGLNYKRYTSEWREAMRHTALLYLLKYCHNYDPEKAKRRRLELNEKRKKPLAPVDDGKIAFNYVSWTANTAISSTVGKLNEKFEKKDEVGLGEDRMLNTLELDEEVINYYNLKNYDNSIEFTDEEGEEIDPLEVRRKQNLEDRIKRYSDAAIAAANKYLEKHPKERKRVYTYIMQKWGVDLDTGLPILDIRKKIKKSISKEN